MAFLAPWPVSQRWEGAGDMLREGGGWHSAGSQVYTRYIAVLSAKQKIQQNDAEILQHFEIFFFSNLKMSVNAELVHLHFHPKLGWRSTRKKAHQRRWRSTFGSSSPAQVLRSKRSNILLPLSVTKGWWSEALLDSDICDIVLVSWYHCILNLIKYGRQTQFLKWWTKVPLWSLIRGIYKENNESQNYFLLSGNSTMRLKCKYSSDTVLFPCCMAQGKRSDETKWLHSLCTCDLLPPLTACGMSIGDRQSLFRKITYPSP